MDPLGRATVPDLTRVESQLSELWRNAATGEEPVTRACSLNLVVACYGGSDELNTVTRLVAGIAATEPGRAIVVHVDPSRPAHGLDVWVSAHCHRSSSGAQVCSEQITVAVSPDEMELVPSTVLQLLVGEVPVFSLWRGGTLRDRPLLDALYKMSDRLVVDTARAEQPQTALESMNRFALAVTDGDLADLTWERLAPWREAVAALFDAAQAQAALAEATALEVVTPEAPGGVATPAAYMAGWLASRLGWTHRGDHWIRADGQKVTVTFPVDTALPPDGLGAVRLVTGPGGTRFSAERRPQGVELCVEGPDACAVPWAQAFPERDEASLLCGLMQRADVDALFAPAVHQAVLMVR